VTRLKQVSQLKQLFCKQVFCIIMLTIGIIGWGCSAPQGFADPIEGNPSPAVSSPQITQSQVAQSQVAQSTASPTSKAIFAGGCFWCMEKPFDEIPGVIETTSGYTGGNKVNPSYREVSSGTTGHTESVQITYDPKQVSYEKLLQVFWRNIDPLDGQGQFCDKGSQYRSAIFYSNEQQKAVANQSKTEVAQSKGWQQSIVTEVSPASTFYPAEGYHQNYYKTNAVKYKFYRFACGRDQRLKELWGE
jgi:peptide-methionine (S)-S-oxide reductase